MSEDLDYFPDFPKPEINESLLCGRCYREVKEDELFDSNCGENPENLMNSAIGMYHCPDCGTMLLAGLPHPKVCKSCSERQTDGFDR